MDQTNKWDGVLISMLQERQNYDNFFEYMFDFLRRKTDFFTDMKKAEQTIAKAGQKSMMKNKGAAEEKKKKEEEKRKRDAERAAKRQQKMEEARKKAEAQAQKQAEEKAEAGGEEEKKEDEEKTEAPPGNGAVLEKYTWTQTLGEVDIQVWLPAGFNRKELTVTFEADHVFVGLKGQDPILDGKWPEEVDIDESLWTLEDDDEGNRFLHLALTKWKTKEGWWKQVVEGEEEIDTSKINPEPSKLHELDPEMRGQVSKMMFDMRQKQMGKPSSEELEKQQKLQQFMKAHPEMDFSNAKFA